MIKKLQNKISLIILSAISIPLILIVTFLTHFYYDNTIISNTRMVDRFLGEPKGKPGDRLGTNPEITTMDGIYSLTIINGEIKQVSDNVTDEIKEYALKVSKTTSENGIIGSYIYKKRPEYLGNSDMSVILIESKDEIDKLNFMIISSILVTCTSIILIYILSKKISFLIVKPVEETFSKQIDFISDASHELKTPLAVIEANADVLEGEFGKNKWLTYIQNETTNMGKLISELLLLTKIENVDKLRSPEEFNMSNHIELVVASFESMAFEKNVKIETEIQQDIITTTFNRDDIEHILSTLIDNAIKHTEEKKKVVVEFKKNKDNILINVKNKGKEIPLKERDKIFDRFYRIDKSRNRDEKRYGLGLSIARATVLKNNGTINVDYKDGYTIFSVKLPI